MNCSPDRTPTPKRAPLVETTGLVHAKVAQARGTEVLSTTALTAPVVVLQLAAERELSMDDLVDSRLDFNGLVQQPKR